MILLGLLAGIAANHVELPFTETFGPDGEQKSISQGYVSCDGRSEVQTKQAMEDLIMADTDAEAKYALRLNKCSYIENEGPKKRIHKVLDKRCIDLVKRPGVHHCKFEYYLFQLQDTSGHRFYAIYAPYYE